MAKRAKRQKARPKRSPNRKTKAKPQGGDELAFDHVFLATRDFPRAWKFWTEVVGLKGASKWGTPEYAGSVKLGDGSIVVAQGEEGFYDELGYTSEVGKPQLYVRARDVDGLHRRMVERGANVVRSPLTTHFGLRCFSVEGPDGMVVVFVEAK
jgi:catechol 2,3-dioxygenase-like lactoylglutathione lyase family enzyme